MRIRDRFDRSKRQPSTRTQRIGFAFFWHIVLCYAFFVASDANWNTESHLYPAVSLVDHRSINIDLYQQGLGDKSLYNGHYYSDKAPGLSLLAVPIYGALHVIMPGKRIQPYQTYTHMRYSIQRSSTYVRYAITYILVILPSALFAVLLWLFLCRFASVGWALTLATVYALGTLAYPFSVRFYSHQLTAVLLFSAFMLIYLRVRHGTDARKALWSSALAGLLAGYSVISEYPTMLIALILLGYLALVARAKLRNVVTFVGGMAPPAIVCAAYNVVAFGSPLATGYMHTHSALYNSNVSGGPLGLVNPLSYGLRWPSLSALWEITFGAYRGIFLVSPVLLLFAVGIAAMWRRREMRPELWLCLVTVLVYFLFDASHDSLVNGWSGGTSVASRHLTPLMPFMTLPLVFGLRDRAFRVAFVLLGAVSIALMFMTVSSVGLYGMMDHNPLVHEVFPRFFGGKMDVNWGYMLGVTDLRSLLPLAAIAALLTFRIVWLVRSDERRLTDPRHIVAEVSMRSQGRIA